MGKLDLIAPFVVAVIFAARLATYEPSRDVKPSRVIDGDVKVNASNIRSFDDVVEIRGHLIIEDTALTEINLRDFPRLKNVTGNIDIYKNDELVSLASAFPSLEFVGDIIVAFNSQLKSITASFPRLKHVTYSISVSMSALVSLTNAFPSLESVGMLVVDHNSQLKSITASFPRARVNRSVYIGDNALLTTITSSFTRAEPNDAVAIYNNPNLTTVTNSFHAYNGSVCWYDNGVALNNSGLDLELAPIIDCHFD